MMVIRQVFYLPVLATVISIALLAGAGRLGFAWPARLLFLLLAIPVSLQLLPPAWSPASLTTPEFRLQFIALALSWLMLACFWLLGRLPHWLTGGAVALLSAVTTGATLWQTILVKGPIDAVYGRPASLGWGLVVCFLGLVLVGSGGALYVSLGQRRRGEST
jgi:hypothetical protein